MTKRARAGCLQKGIRGVADGRDQVRADFYNYTIVWSDLGKLLISYIHKIINLTKFQLNRARSS